MNEGSSRVISMINVCREIEKNDNGASTSLTRRSRTIKGGVVRSTDQIITGNKTDERTMGPAGKGNKI